MTAIIVVVEHEERPRPPPRDLRDPEYFDTNERGPQSDGEPETDEDEEPEEP